jgi:hypothetical protein
MHHDVGIDVGAPPHQALGRSRLVEGSGKEQRSDSLRETAGHGGVCA